MTFKKNQRVTSRATGAEFRVESGPWDITTGDESYLVERLAEHTYVLTLGKNLMPITPRQGDRGRLTGTCWERYSPHRLVYLDSKVILLEDEEGDYMSQTGKDRERILASWEPVE